MARWRLSCCQITAGEVKLKRISRGIQGNMKNVFTAHVNGNRDGYPGSPANRWLLQLND